MLEARSAKTTPLRFMYMSGFMVDRDPDKRYDFMPEYGAIRVCSSSSSHHGASR